MNTNTSIFNKDLLVDTPPPFYGEMFEAWKARFKKFIKSKYFKMWDFLMNGPFIPTFSYKDKIVNKLGFH